VATTIFEGADAIMLSAETALGQHPVEAVEVMSRVAARAERETTRSAAPPPRPEA
jgi:pyruvate kinase